jgi:hypothetical protein
MRADEDNCYSQVGGCEEAILAWAERRQKEGLL